MTRYLTEWSLTRRKIFTNCARRFAIKYFSFNKRTTSRQNKTSFISYSDLMVRCTRIVLFELLNDLHKGVYWSNKVIVSKLRFQLNVHISSRDKLNMSLKRKNRLILHAHKRIKKLMKQEILRKIAANSITEWSFHDRVQSTRFGHLNVYCSPDIVYRKGAVWHLVRLNFQAENKQPFLDLELCSMLLWSRGNHYLPNLEHKFVIHGLSWHRGKWYYKKIRPSQKLLQETKQLLEKDVHNFNVLYQEFYRSGNFDKLPLANTKLYCRRCPYQPKCPVNEQAG